MEGKQAVEVFDLAVRGKQLPAKLDDLVTLGFIGQTAVNFYREKVALMDRLDVAEEQKIQTLRDGQDAGKMLLAIEARIGELLPTAEEAQRLGGGDKTAGSIKVLPAGITSIRARNARAIAAAEKDGTVAAVIAEAEENEDIPTKTAVLNRIKADKAKKKLDAFKAKNPPVQAVDKPDINNVLMDLHGKLLELRGKLRDIYAHKEHLNEDLKDSIRYVAYDIFKIVSDEEGGDE
jgi:hypothetical protein